MMSITFILRWAFLICHCASVSITGHEHAGDTAGSARKNDELVWHQYQPPTNGFLGMATMDAEEKAHEIETGFSSINSSKLDTLALVCVEEKKALKIEPVDTVSATETVEKTERSGGICRRALRLLIKALNVVSKKMDLEIMDARSNMHPVLETAIERFKQVLELLSANGDDFSIEVYGLKIDKSSIYKSLERIEEYGMEVGEIKGRNSGSFILYKLFFGSYFSDRTSSECLSACTVHFMKHALAAFPDIPNVIIDEHDNLIVDNYSCRGIVQQGSKKRKRDSTSQQGSRKKKYGAHHADRQANKRLLLKLHNEIVEKMNLMGLEISPTTSESFDQICSSIQLLIKTALNRVALLIHPIHDNYKIDKSYLESLGVALDGCELNWQNKALDLLMAFDATTDINLNGVNLLLSLGHWYAAVALAVLPDLGGKVKYMNGELFVHARPFRRWQGQVN